MIWVGTSWKMNFTRLAARQFAATLAAANTTQRWPGIQPFVLPPFTALAEVSALLAGTGVLVGAQNAHWEDEGAWTGEISVPQARDGGASLIEIGHSERREHFGETDETVRRKVAATLRHGLTPLVCVGESAAVYAAGGSVDFILAQTAAALAGLSDGHAAQVLVAYEPIWAIGARGRAARPQDLTGAFAALHAEFGSRVQALLYGGSVSLANAIATLEVPHVQGLFIGRAAWQVEGYLAIADAVAAWKSGRTWHP